MIQPYGYAVPTPRLQQLAEEGVLFRQAFCGAPTCSPSRAALLTGQSAHASGMLGLAHRGFRLNDPTQHLAYFLRSHGYTTVLTGMQHVAAAVRAGGHDDNESNSDSGDGIDIGYNIVRTPPTRDAAHVAPIAVDFLHNAPAEPFFLDVGFTETHRDFPELTDPDAGRYLQPPRPLPDVPAIRQDFAAYCASAAALDAGVGKVLDALAETGLAERTLVIYTTDHGLAFPGMKCNLTDHGIGVALILRGPNSLADRLAGGRVVDALTSHIDLYPTLCELLDLPRPAWLTGQSLVPLLSATGNSPREVNDAIFAEVTYHAAYEPMRAVRTQRYKYIRRYGLHRTPVLTNCDESPSKSYWLEHGWAARKLPREELYDLVFAPNEGGNLAADPAYQVVLADMRRRLDQWMQTTDDPLRLGDVAAPSGALVNDPAGQSPRDPAVRVP